MLCATRTTRLYAIAFGLKSSARGDRAGKLRAYLVLLAVLARPLGFLVV
jgi:hypothetical protein